MKHQLSEQEFNSMIRRSEHNHICYKYKQKIRTIEDSIAILRLQLKLRSEKENVRLSVDEIKLLFGYMGDRTKELIKHLVKNHRKSISAEEGFPIKFALMVNGDWCGLSLAEETYINREGKIMDANDNDIEFDTLAIDAIVKLAIYIDNYCKQQERSQQKL